MSAYQPEHAAPPSAWRHQARHFRYCAMAPFWRLYGRFTGARRVEWATPPAGLRYRYGALIGNEPGGAP